MDTALFNRYLQILKGDIFEVKCNGEPYSFYYKNRDFFCETNTITYIPAMRTHHTIAINWGEDTLYGIKALLLRSPNNLYNFMTISTTCEEIKYSSLQLLLDKNKQSEIKNILKGLNLENVNYCGCSGLNINSEIIEFENHCMVNFKLNQEVSHEYIVGIALRIAHSLCFVYGNFNAAPIAIIFSDNNYTLTCTGNFDLIRPYSIFTLPHQFDYYNQDKYYPILTKEFIYNFIKMTIENDYFFDILLATMENAKFDAYTNANTCFVALEKFAQNNSKKSTIPENWKIKINEIKEIIKDYIKQNNIQGDLNNFINRKLNGLSNPLNSDRLKMACESIGYELNEADNKTLQDRNKFFHGSLAMNALPPNDKYEIILRIHRLVCVLLAKRAGYSGYICQYDQFLPYQGKDKRVEDIFIQI